MSSESDRRAPPPRHLATLFVTLGEDMVPFGRTRDLSTSGIFLITEQRPPVASLCSIAFVWGEFAYQCQARVVRHASDGVGLAFVTFDESFARAIEEILDGSPKINRSAT